MKIGMKIIEFNKILRELLSNYEMMEWQNKEQYLHTLYISYILNIVFALSGEDVDDLH